MFAKQNQPMQQEVARKKGTLNSQEKAIKRIALQKAGRRLPSPFLNVIWDPQISYERALFLIWTMADAGGFMKCPDMITANRIRRGREPRGPVSAPSCVKTIHGH